MMMKLLLPATVVVFAMTGAAVAAQTTGEVTSVNRNAITLADGTTYRLGPSVDTTGLRRHWDVEITYDMVNGQRVASNVTMKPGFYPDNAPGEDNPAAQ